VGVGRLIAENSRAIEQKASPGQVNGSVIVLDAMADFIVACAAAQ
jgi:hypothetical protein